MPMSYNRYFCKILNPVVYNCTYRHLMIAGLFVIISKWRKKAGRQNTRQVLESIQQKEGERVFCRYHGYQLCTFMRSASGRFGVAPCKVAAELCLPKMNSGAIP